MKEGEDRSKEIIQVFGIAALPALGWLIAFAVQTGQYLRLGVPYEFVDPSIKHIIFATLFVSWGGLSIVNTSSQIEEIWSTKLGMFVSVLILIAIGMFTWVRQGFIASPWDIFGGPALLAVTLLFARRWFKRFASESPSQLLLGNGRTVEARIQYVTINFLIGFCLVAGWAALFINNNGPYLAVQTAGTVHPQFVDFRGESILVKYPDDEHGRGVVGLIPVPPDGVKFIKLERNSGK